MSTCSVAPPAAEATRGAVFCPTVLPHHLVWLGGHELVQPGVAGEAVLEGDDASGTADQAAARRHVGDVAELGVGNMQKAGQLLPVGGGLIEQDEEFRVGQHQPGGIGTKQLFDVLR